MFLITESWLQIRFLFIFEKGSHQSNSERSGFELKDPLASDSCVLSTLLCLAL